MELLEPVVEVTVTVPEDAVCGVLGDLAARHGVLSGPTHARVPVAELTSLGVGLRTCTSPFRQ
ncbi:hypothetical protein ACFYXH_40380 [Streptomyces sp. NPDC002730]|uniref:hypothetical protein n=1 Tax=Streptomyces sp. NPDC002730 TaxID=3364662 RepID=UPI00368EF318